VQLQMDVNSSSRLGVSTRPSMLQLTSWGTITTGTLFDFSKHAAQHGTNLANSAQNADGFAQSSD
jgi:hypothetical protein